MEVGFDPYYEWLGIPPSEQPPNHYRLLGIALFESKPTVIEAAADQRMMFLRGLQTGPHSAQSQRLLNEVAAARVCLLRPVNKASYDTALRKRLADSLARPAARFAHGPRLAFAGLAAAVCLAAVGLLWATWSTPGRPRSVGETPLSSTRGAVPAPVAATSTSASTRIPPGESPLAATRAQPESASQPIPPAEAKPAPKLEPVLTTTPAKTEPAPKPVQALVARPAP